MLLRYICRVIRFVYKRLISKIDKIICLIIFRSNNVTFTEFQSSGIPLLLIAQDAEFIIGSNLKLNNRYYSNPLGGINKCTFFVDNNAVLILGNNVGISQSTIICCRKVVIGDNVKIGAGVKIFDSDFHSLNSEVRRSKLDKLNSISLPINIGDNVFIGAFSIILKGVDIGPNSIIAAGSVLSKSVPENQLWAGNPAKFVRDTV